MIAPVAKRRTLPIRCRIKLRLPLIGILLQVSLRIGR